LQFHFKSCSLKEEAALLAVSYCYRNYAEYQRVSIFTQALCKAPESATELRLATSHIQTLAKEVLRLNWALCSS